MALRKKEIPTERSGDSSAFTLPSLMTAMAAPQVELLISNLEAAPDDWNFFSNLPDSKFLELCDSIAEHGLIHPLLVYETPEKKYIILSGHNRVNAYKSLYEVTGLSKYCSIPCIIRSDISEQEARSLLMDANWVQRTLTPSEKARCVARKYSEQNRLPRGSGIRTYDLVAKHFNLKATQVYNYIKIASLPEDILLQVDSGKLSLKAAIALTKLSVEKLSVMRNQLNNYFDTESVLEYLYPQKYETLTFQVPKDKLDVIKKAIEQMIKEFK